MIGPTVAEAAVTPTENSFEIYGMMASVSIGQLFLAGIIPGILMGITMMLTVAYFAHTRNFGRDVPFSLPKLAKATLEVALVACVPLGAWGLFLLGVPGGWSVIIAPWVSGVVFVIGSEMTQRRLAERAVETLLTSRPHVLGAVLNRVDIVRNKYYYSRYYGYKYKNYYVRSNAA